MASHAENALTREGLIWRIMECIAAAENKDFTVIGNETLADREYILKLVREVTHAVGKQSG